MVRLRSDPSSYGVVFVSVFVSSLFPTLIILGQQRTYHEDELPPEASLIDPIMRQLLPDEVAISWSSPDPGQREILQESELSLADRPFQPGDICRKALGGEESCSGVVTVCLLPAGVFHTNFAQRLSVRGFLEHSISGEAIGWRTPSDIEPSKEAEVGDYVVYDDCWVGQVCTHVL